MKSYFMIAAMAISTTSFTYAQPLNYNLVSLSNAAHQMVTQDEMVLQLDITEQGKDRGIVASSVTRKINAVLEMAKQSTQFNTQLTGRNAHPLVDYINGEAVPKGWQETAHIVIKSKDLEALNAFAAKVQDAAAIGAIQYQVSTETLQKAQEALTTKAIQAFTQRAQQITQTLGGHHYKIVQLDIDNGYTNNMPARFALAAMPLSEKSSPAPVQLAAPGEANLTLQVSGKIQIEDMPETAAN